MNIFNVFIVDKSATGKENNRAIFGLPLSLLMMAFIGLLSLR